MSTEQIRAIVVRLLSQIAPDADVGHLSPDANLREEVGLDSMDIVNFMVAIHKELGVDVPERDYGKMSVLSACVDYLAERIAAAPKNERSEAIRSQAPQRAGGNT